MQNLSMEQFGMSHPSHWGTPVQGGTAHTLAVKMLGQLAALVKEMTPDERSDFVRRVLQMSRHNRVGAVHLPTVYHEGTAGIGHVVFGRVPVNTIYRY